LLGVELFVLHKSQLFIDLGISLRYDVLSMSPADRFSRYVFDQENLEKNLSANRSSALEGLGHLFLPVHNFMQLEDSLGKLEKKIWK
jgi:hypothetical protein